VTLLALDTEVRSWSQGRVIAGGSPWRLSMLAPAASAVIRGLQAGPRDAALFEPRAVRALLDRGLIHPCPPVAPTADHRHDAALTVAIPVYDDVEGLRVALESVRGRRIIVVDDGSPNAAAIEELTTEFGATLIAHARNQGPAAARNTALAATRTEFVAFLDSDVSATGDWPSSALWHFDDASVMLVAPRIASSPAGQSWIDRYESVRGTLDMGPARAVVRPRARVGYVPGAAFVARTDMLRRHLFDESLRLGEDVDLVWRMADEGAIVRYDPAVVVLHRNRATWSGWMRQRFGYGTSVSALASRHPGRLAPWRPSVLDATSLGLLVAGRPVAALVPVAITAGVLQASLRSASQSAAAAAAVDTALRGWGNDARGLGHALRREWWPVGAAACVALAVRPTSPAARLAVSCMAVPVITDWWKVRDRIPLPLYAAMRVLDDASYGTGVVKAAVRDMNWRALAPRVMPIRRRPGKSRRPDRAPSIER
jgi:mycofactocin system glycosyltransferase